MLRAAALVLSAVTLLDAKSLDTRRLDPPTNLSLGHENPTQVALYWNFTVPGGTDPADLIFHILVRDGTDTLVRFRQESDGGPCHFMLNSLEPGANYTVELWAAHPRFKSSPVTKTSFTTMQGDWATPVITNVTSMGCRDFVNYTLRWELPHESGHLSHFEVLVCAPACRSFKADPHDFNATVSVPFYTNYTLSVVASYDVPVVGTIARQSPSIKGCSKMGAPSFVDSIDEVSQKANLFTIDWIPPRIANGPLSYYEVVISDPYEPLCDSRVNITGCTRATLLAPSIQGNLFKISVRAVNVDFDGKTYEGEPAIIKIERDEILSTKDVKILNRRPEMIHFQILAAYPQDNVIFFADYPDSIRLVYQKSDEMEAIHLQPFQTYFVNVSACYPTSDYNKYTCGEPSRHDLVSNVGYPSEVRNLVIRLSRDNFIVGAWGAPQVRNGPVHTYSIEIVFTDKASRKTGLHQFYTNTSYLELRKKESWEDSSLQIGVAAVNFDLDNSTINYTSRIVYAKPYMHRRQENPQSLFATVGVGLVIAIICILVLALCYCTRGPSSGSSQGGSLGDDDPPPYETPSPPPTYERALAHFDQNAAANEGQGVAEQGF